MLGVRVAATVAALTARFTFRTPEPTSVARAKLLSPTGKGAALLIRSERYSATVSPGRAASGRAAAPAT